MHCNSEFLINDCPPLPPPIPTRALMSIPLKRTPFKQLKFNIIQVSYVINQSITTN